MKKKLYEKIYLVKFIARCAKNTMYIYMSFPFQARIYLLVKVKLRLWFNYRSAYCTRKISSFKPFKVHFWFFIKNCVAMNWIRSKRSIRDVVCSARQIFVLNNVEMRLKTCSNKGPGTPGVVSGVTFFLLLSFSCSFLFFLYGLSNIKVLNKAAQFTHGSIVRVFARHWNASQLHGITVARANFLPRCTSTFESV